MSNLMFNILLINFALCMLQSSKYIQFGVLFSSFCENVLKMVAYDFLKEPLRSSTLSAERLYNVLSVEALYI